MPERRRFVADTNVLISRLLYRHSLPAQAFRLATENLQIIVSSATMEELATVLSRPKFDRYLNLDERLAFLDRVRRAAIPIVDRARIKACRDPEDDKFLSLAVSGQASFILSGDADLLSLHSFRGIEIISPRTYLDRHFSEHTTL